MEKTKNLRIVHKNPEVAKKPECERVFAFDLGNTSVGWAVVDLPLEGASNAEGSVVDIGSRIFPSTRGTDLLPLNVDRRTKRSMRRQLRRRKMRRRALNEALTEMELLPKFDKTQGSEWDKTMSNQTEYEPYGLRVRALQEKLTAFELGRALYHLAHNRHFKGKEEEEENTNKAEETNDEKETKEKAGALGARLKKSGDTLAMYLVRDKKPLERKHGEHVGRWNIEDEFNRIADCQQKFYPQVDFTRLQKIIFDQKPVFWRTNTLGSCPLLGGSPAAAASWWSKERLMLERINTLKIREVFLTEQERESILAKLKNQQTMSYAKAREAIKDSLAQKGLDYKKVAFNLETKVGKKAEEKTLAGNDLELKLGTIFGASWENHPHQEAIRGATETLRQAQYGQIPETGPQRIVLLPSSERTKRKKAAAEKFAQWGASPQQIEELANIKFAAGWDRFSVAAIQILLPELRKGLPMGTILSSPDYAAWRKKHFPNYNLPSGQALDLIPSPQSKEEAQRLRTIRNPDVIRVLNELRKVTNNLIRAYGKPDKIRMETTRDFGLSKRDKEQREKDMSAQETRRKKVADELVTENVKPNRANVEKFLLWKECGEVCPYTGQKINFEDLFVHRKYEVEHIWPRPRSPLGDNFANKTLCERSKNQEKGDRIPFEAFGNKPEWAAMEKRIKDMEKSKSNPGGMSSRKVANFLATEIPSDFAERQLNTTSYAIKEAVKFLKRLWPNMDDNAQEFIQSYSGKVTAAQRRLWGLNSLLDTPDQPEITPALDESGETEVSLPEASVKPAKKNRNDHRHHAIDAAIVACATPSILRKLLAILIEEERKRRAKDRNRSPKDYDRAHQDPRLQLPPPFPNFREQLEKSVEKIVVSHRVSKKVSGALHEETILGSTNRDPEKDSKGKETYRYYVKRVAVSGITPATLADIRDAKIRELVFIRLKEKGVEIPPPPGKIDKVKLKAALATPLEFENGVKIEKVRIWVKQNPELMAKVTTGFVSKDALHHMVVWQNLETKKIDAEAISLFEVAKRLSKKQPLIHRQAPPNCQFLMTLSPREVLHFPPNTQISRKSSKLKKYPEGYKEDISGFWVIEGFLSNLPLKLRRLHDARPSSFFPGAATIIELGAKKVSIDPIGRIRPAND